MILYDWIITQLLPIFIPQSVLDSTLFYFTGLTDGASEPVSVGRFIGLMFSVAVGFCSVYFLVWVPFRGILYIIRWKRWRGYR